MEGDSVPAKAAALLRSVHESAVDRARLVVQREELVAAGVESDVLAAVDQEIAGHDALVPWVQTQLERLRASYGSDDHGPSFADILIAQGWRSVPWVPDDLFRTGV